MEESKPKARRGFAAMTPEQIRAISAKGGKASHASGNAHQWDAEAARIAGQKGGRVSGTRKKVEKAEPPAQAPREDSREKS